MVSRIECDDEPVEVATTTMAPVASAPFAEIERQFTRYVRDPDNSPLPPGTEVRRMRLLAKHFRTRLLYALRLRAPNLVGALGEDKVLTLLDDHVRVPRAAHLGESSFEGSFLHWIKAEWSTRGLPPWIPDVADFCMSAMLMDSPLEESEQATANDGDLLEGVPAFSKLAKLQRFEWPAHRICKDYIPTAKPQGPVWLVVYRNRRGRGAFVELNPQAAEIAARVRDNSAGRTGAELIADCGACLRFVEPAAALRLGLGVLEALRQRDIILCNQESEAP